MNLWLQNRVLRDRFQAGTAQEPYCEALRDLVIGTFDLLGHTPLRLLGINRDLHYRLASEEARNALGDLLTPKEHWKDILTGPGLQNLTMGSPRSDDLDGYIRVTLGPSPLVPNGVVVSINDHYQLPSAPGHSGGATEMISILREQ